ncbi:MAG: TolC family protein [Fulvivirga sp.]|nr:TolC family protein [Fulvivirga sp.]
MNHKLLIISLLILVCTGLHAQEKLSLNEAIQRGLEQNYDIRIERRNVEIAENNNSWGEAGMMPNVSLNATSNNSVFNNKSGDQFFNGATFPGFELNNQRNRSVTPSVNANMTIFNGFKVRHNKSRLENLQRETQGNAEIVIANTVQAIVLGYYVAVLEKERLDVFKKQLALSRYKYNKVKVRKDLGSAVSTDLLLEEGNYLNDSVNYINQQLRYRDSIRDLNFLINERNIDHDYQFVDELRDEVEEIEYAKLANKLESKNIDLQTLYLSQSVLNNDVAIAKADRMPQLSMDLGYRYNRTVQDLTDATSPNADIQTPPDVSVNKRGTYYANFTLSFTLFNGNRINRAIKNAMVREDIGNLRVDRMRLSLNRDLADTYDQYQTRKLLYNINQRRVAASQTNLNISENKFETGSINSFDFRTVQNNNLDASIQALNSLYDLIESKVSLMRLTGGIIDNYVN